jgi:hypothetical protein
MSLVFKVISSVTRSPVPYNVAKIALSRAIFNGFFSNIQGASRISWTCSSERYETLLGGIFAKSIFSGDKVSTSLRSINLKNDLNQTA